MSHAASLSLCLAFPLESSAPHNVFNTGLLTFRLFVCAGVALVHFQVQALNIHGNISALGEFVSQNRIGYRSSFSLCCVTFSDIEMNYLRKQ